MFHLLFWPKWSWLPFKVYKRMSCEEFKFNFCVCKYLPKILTVHILVFCWNIWKGWVILSYMGDLCKFYGKDGWLFSTHFFTNSKYNALYWMFIFAAWCYSELTNKRADRNKRVSMEWRFFSFIIWKMRVWWKLFSFVTWKIDCTYDGKKSKKTKRDCSFNRKFRRSIDFCREKHRV